MSVKVMLVDDHIIVREGIKKILESDVNIEVIGEASDGIECLEKLERIKPQIIILDINMPGKNGLEVIEEIRKKSTYIKIIILTAYCETSYITRALEYGANAYLSKGCDTLELKKTMLKVLNNESYIQQNLSCLIDNITPDKTNDKSKITSLTNREMEVLVQIANGMFNKEIATSLNISERTVKNHVSSIFKKIGVSDRTQAAVFAIKNNVVSL